MHATDQTFQILLSQLLEKVEDRCPECGSEQYVWQQWHVHKNFFIKGP